MLYFSVPKYAIICFWHLIQGEFFWLNWSVLFLKEKAKNSFYEFVKTLILLNVPPSVPTCSLLSFFSCTLLWAIGNPLWRKFLSARSVSSRRRIQPWGRFNYEHYNCKVRIITMVDPYLQWLTPIYNGRPLGRFNYEHYNFKVTIITMVDPN